MSALIMNLSFSFEDNPFGSVCSVSDDEPTRPYTPIYILYSIKVNDEIGIMYGAESPDHLHNPEFFIHKLQENQIGFVVSLEQFSSSSVCSICQENGIGYEHFSYRDGAVPKSIDAEKIRKIAIELRKQNKNVLIHCTFGRGRTVAMIKMIGALSGTIVDVDGQLKDKFNVSSIDSIPTPYAPSMNMAQEMAIYDLLETVKG